MNTAPAVFDPSGALLACADGPELVVYSGADGAPIWKQFVQGILVGVGISGDAVVAVDTDGAMWWWRRLDGALIREARLDMRCSHLISGGPDGLCAVVGERQVALVSAKGDFDLIHGESVVAGAFGPKGLLLGFANGVAELRDVKTGDALAMVALGEAIHAVAWSALGSFWIAAGSSLHGVERVKITPPTLPDGRPAPIPMGVPLTELKVSRTVRLEGPARGLAISSDGIVAALAVGECEAVVLELGGDKVVGRITLARPLSQVCFGLQHHLALTTDDTEFLRVDLTTGNEVRPSPGLGRVPTPWAAQVDLQIMALRGALASAKAGGKQIATRVERGGFFDEVAGEEGGRRWWLWGCAAALLIAGCCGCLGTVALYFR